MGNICVCLALLWLIAPTYAQIRNGYADDITGAWSSRKHLDMLLRQPNLTPAERQKLQDCTRKVTELIVHYELTQRLLDEFRFLAPALYNEIDTLHDDTGRSAIVNVKFVSDENASGTSHGMTCIVPLRSETSPDALTPKLCLLVEVRIARKSLIVLAHELGHIRHVLPHLTDYLRYYERTYHGYSDNRDFSGHDENDISGKSAEDFSKRFRLLRYAYWRKTQEKSISPADLVVDIRKQLAPNTMIAMYGQRSEP